jgi:D-arabinono-1,4-lactone oxidase
VSTVSPTFPFTEVKSVTRWSNYSGTIGPRAVPVYCTPDVMGDAGMDAPRKLRRHGAALEAIIGHVWSTPGATLRAVGSRWSFSSIIQPGDVVVDPANLNTLLKVKPEWLNEGYRRGRFAQGFVPVFAQGGTQIASINRRLLDVGLALQTSGAGDGHRLAGCLATGTHGSALGIGAVHDTVLAVHLITSPHDSVFLQPERAACGPEVAAWLARETGIPTRPVQSDQLFAAAQVGLGSLGFVHGLVMETVPLYALRGRILARPFADAQVWKTLDDLDTSRLHPDVAERPYHFEVVFHPYPSSSRPGAFVRMFWKVSASAVPNDSPLPVPPDLASDTMGLIGKLTGLVDGALPTLVLRSVIGDQLSQRFVPGDKAPALPGMVWGPTSLPPGHGTSTEVVVDQRRAHRALELLFDILRTRADKGEHLLGAVATRFVPKTRALLGMNQSDMSCFIELPSIRNGEVEGLYRAFWDALEKDGVPFTCHWGQTHGMNPKRLTTYFGPNVERWKAARDELLPTPEAKRVFQSAILGEVGLS